MSSRVVFDPVTGEIKEVLNERGWETGGGDPVAIPAGFKRPETLAEQVQRLVRRQISAEAADAGYETFEDSEDFDIGDDPPDPTAPYETFFDPVLGRDLSAAEFRQNWHIYRERFVKAEEEAWKVMDRSDALRRRPREAEPAKPERSVEPQAGPLPSNRGGAGG